MSPTLLRSGSPPAEGSSEGPQASIEETLAHIEKVRLMVIGMEQRLEVRETQLTRDIEKAEGESARFGQLQKEILAG